MILQVEDYYQETSEKGGRKLNYIILSNRIDMEKVILVDKEKARDSIN